MLHKLEGLGGACKRDVSFCGKCEWLSSEICFYWEGDERCELFCKKYGNTKCRHFTVNTSIEIERKKRLLLFYLVQYHQETMSDRLIPQLQVISPKDILTMIAPPLDEIDVLKHIEEDT